MITQGQLRLISRHYAGHGEPYAFLELAQEHFLLWMMREGLFDIGPEDVVFKGGTAIRKYRLGLRGRFSTDLDFAIADGAYADHIITSLDHGLIDLEGVRFRATSIDLPAAKAQWIAVVDGLGETMEANIEFTRRPTLLMPTMPETRPDIPGFSPQLIGFDLPLVPLMRLEENLSEKLARFRRIILAGSLRPRSHHGRAGRLHLDAWDRRQHVRPDGHAAGRARGAAWAAQSQGPSGGPSSSTRSCAPPTARCPRSRAPSSEIRGPRPHSIHASLPVSEVPE